MRRIDLDKDKLYDLYIIQNKSLDEVAKELGTTARTVQRKATNFGFYKTQENKRALREKTTLERYGVVNAYQSKELMKDSNSKRKQTLKEKYGVEHNLQIPEVADKIKTTKIHNYYTHPEDILNKEGLINWAIKFKKEHNHKPKYSDLAEYQDCSYLAANKYVLVHQLQHLFTIGGFSNLEDTIENFIKTLNVEYRKHDRAHIYPQELDFYFPEQKIAIEVNDIASHNVTCGFHDCSPKVVSYHQDKSITCIEAGIRLIHIWEWEITNNNLWNKIQQYLKKLLAVHSTNKIFARKCSIKEIDWRAAGKFYDLYHLQGRGKTAKISYGLFYNNELVSCMSFGIPNFNKKYEWELLRYTSKFRL